MAEHHVTLQATFDDSTNQITITGMAPPPPGPDELVAAGLWFGQTGPGFTFTVKANKRDLTPNPTAIYIVPGSEPVERRLVEYRNGKWQMPGQPYTEE